MKEVLDCPVLSGLILPSLCVSGKRLLTGLQCRLSVGVFEHLAMWSTGRGGGGGGGRSTFSHVSYIGDTCDVCLMSRGVSAIVSDRTTRTVVTAEVNRCKCNCLN